MSMAIQLAKRGRYTCQPNPQVGCVIVRNNQLLGSGWHVRAGERHAEINALANVEDASGARLYVSLEPCSHTGRTPPCVTSIIDSDITEVYIAMRDPNPLVSGKGIEVLEQAGINVKQGLLEEQARALNPGFIQRMENNRPYIRCKLAMSVDGKTALANGNSQWISSEQSRHDVHKMRAASSAIMTTADNVIKDNPALTARGLTFEHRQPLRIVIDRNLKVPADARTLNQEGRTIIYSEQNVLTDNEKGQAEIVSIPASDDWLEQVMNHLATHYEVNDLLIEAGSEFCAALLQHKLIDELIIYVAPRLLGSDARSLLSFTGLQELDQAYALSLRDIRQFGDDIRLNYSIM